MYMYICICPYMHMHVDIYTNVATVCMLHISIYYYFAKPYWYLNAHVNCLADVQTCIYIYVCVCVCVFACIIGVTCY